MNDLFERGEISIDNVINEDVCSVNDYYNRGGLEPRQELNGS